MNQWVRDALEASGMTQQGLADRLSGHPGMPPYAKSMVNKMTKSRKVSLAEARAISDITGHPLPVTKVTDEIVAEIESLHPDDRKAVITLIHNLAQKPKAP